MIVQIALGIVLAVIILAIGAFLLQAAASMVAEVFEHLPTIAAVVGVCGIIYGLITIAQYPGGLLFTCVVIVAVGGAVYPALMTHIRSERAKAARLEHERIMGRHAGTPQRLGHFTYADDDPTDPER